MVLALRNPPSFVGAEGTTRCQDQVKGRP